MVKVKSDTCIGCGACVAIAPDTFEFDENGLSKVIEGALESDAAKEAAGSCPVGAIEIGTAEATEPVLEAAKADEPEEDIAA